MKLFSGSGPVSHPLQLSAILTLLVLAACGTRQWPERDPAPGDDTVDIGYGTAEKEHVVGSVAEVEGENERGREYRSLAEMLQDKIPGVQVTELPGGRMTVRIRGTSSFMSSEEPLFVLDGMPLHSSESLVGISPSEVEKITVLKDAGATAIYGSRGANGVILIKTKKG